MVSLVGQKIGKYQITRMIARGGMADVYRAKQDGLNRDVAIKVMHMYLAQADVFVTRFRREATSVAKMRHPHIIQLYDFDMSGDQYYMVMEYISGRTLEQLIAELDRIPYSRVLNILLPLTDALEYAHGLGIVHRDIKPSNIMFSDTQCSYPILADFGINLTSGNTSLTMEGGFVGTPGYMSPEAIMHKPVDKRADIYSLGVVLYEMLTGEHPFKGDSVEAFFASQLNEPFQDPRQIVPDIPVELVDILRKCITVLPDDRYNSIKEMKADLERLQRHTPVEPQALIADDPLRGALLNDLSAEPEDHPELEFAKIGTDGNLIKQSPKTITLDSEVGEHLTPTPIAIPNMATPVLTDAPAPIVVQPAIPTSRRQSLRIAAYAMVAAMFILLTGNHFWVDAVSGKQSDLPFSTVHLNTTSVSSTRNWAIPVLDDILASSPNTANVHTTIMTAAPTDVPTTIPTSVPTTAPTDIPTTAPTDVPTIVPTDIPTIAPTDIPTLIPSTAVEIAIVPTVMPNTTVPNDQPERLLVGDDVVRHISSSNPSQNYVINPSAIDTLLLTVSSKQVDAKLTVELTNQNTGETVAFLRPAVTAVCIRISAGTDLYNLKINSDNKSVDSDYTLRLVTARQTQLDCPADPSQ